MDEWDDGWGVRGSRAVVKAGMCTCCWVVRYITT